MRRRISSGLQAAIILVILGTALLNVRELQHRFGAYDLSPLIDSAWRVWRGQVPNRDFICTFPPLLYMVVSLGFRVVGIRWAAMGLVSGVLAVALSLLGVRLTSLLRPVVGGGPALLTSLMFTMAQMIPLLLVGHPWHSAMSQTFACYALLATYTMLKLDGEERQHRTELVVHVTVAIATLLLLKPNLSLPTIVVCLAALTISRLRIWAAVAAVGGVAISSLLLMPFHTSLIATFRVYGQLGERFFPNYLLLGVMKERSIPGGLVWLIVFLPMAPLLGLFGWELWENPRGLLRPRLLLAFGGALVTVLGLGTDYEVRLVEAPAIVVGFSLLLLERPEQTARLRGPLLRAGAAFIAVAMFFSVLRIRMQFVGPWAAEVCGPQISIEDHFFGRFWNCAALGDVLGETDQAVKTHPGARVFFGPRMEFQYAREGIASPLRLPLWWHAGTSYPRPMEEEIVRSWEDDDFDLLVFAHDDRTSLPAGILRDVSRDFVQTAGTKETDVFVRRR